MTATRSAGAVRDTLPPADVTPIRRPARAPTLNAYPERFVRTIKDSCLERMVLIGEGSRRRAGREFVAHDHHKRNHQGLRQSPEPAAVDGTHRHPVVASRAASGSVGCCTTTLGQQRDT